MSKQNSADDWQIPEQPTIHNMRQNYLYLLEHIRDFKGDRIADGCLSDDQAHRMEKLLAAGLVRTEWFNTTNAGMARNLALYYLLTDVGAALLAEKRKIFGELVESLPGYIKDCYIITRKGDELYDSDGRATLKGYAIVPLEEYANFDHLRNVREVAIDRGFLPKLPKKPTNPGG